MQVLLRGGLAGQVKTLASVQPKIVALATIVQQHVLYMYAMRSQISAVNNKLQASAGSGFQHADTTGVANFFRVQVQHLQAGQPCKVFRKLLSAFLSHVVAEQPENLQAALLAITKRCAPGT